MVRYQDQGRLLNNQIHSMQRSQLDETASKASISSRQAEDDTFHRKPSSSMHNNRLWCGLFYDNNHIRRFRTTKEQEAQGWNLCLCFCFFDFFAEELLEA